MAKVLGCSTTCVNTRWRKLDLPFFKGSKIWSLQQSARTRAIYNHRPRNATWKAGPREDLNDLFFRSAWEANYARYLEWLKKKGEIFDWKYEPDTFWFFKIKRGVRSYKPDFKVWEKQDSKPYYIEIKGWMDPRSKTKLKRMAKYYPQIKIVIVDRIQYREIAKWQRLIPGWETVGAGRNLLR